MKHLIVIFFLFYGFSTFAQRNTVTNGIRYDGNVGIGVNPWEFSLRIVSAGSNDGQLGLKAIGEEAFLTINNGDNWGLLMRSDINEPKIGAWTVGALHVHPYSTSDGTLDTSKGALATFDFATMRMGIGSTSPLEKLHIEEGALQFYKVGRQDNVDIIKIAEGTDNGFFLQGMFQGIGPSGNALRFKSVWEDNLLLIRGDGNVGIGTTSPTEKLSVDGNILAKKVRVSIDAADWPDYVFEPSYQLMGISELEQYVQSNKHLPDVPSAKQVEKEGLDLGDMDATLLKKIEELALYTIDQEKRIKKQDKLISELLRRLEKLEKKD